MKLKPLALVAVIGAVISIAGVFLTWATGSFDYLLGTENLDFTGWEFINDENLDDVADFDRVPGFTLVLSAVCLVMCLVPVFRTDRCSRALSGCTAVVCSLLVIFQALFAGAISDGLKLFGFRVVESDPGIGLWISMAGCIVMVLGSVVNILAKPLPENGPSE